MKRIIIALGLLLSAISISAKHSDWMPGKKCTCTCHKYQRPNRKQIRESASLDEVQEDHLTAGRTALEPDISEQRDAMRSAYQAAEMADASSAQVELNAEELEIEKTMRGLKDQYTPEQIDRIIQSMDDFEVLEDAYDEWEYSKQQYRQLCNEDDMPDLDDPAFLEIPKREEAEIEAEAAEFLSPELAQLDKELREEERKPLSEIMAATPGGIKRTSQNAQFIEMQKDNNRAADLEMEDEISASSLDD